MIRCEVPGCGKFFENRGGYLSHLRAHVRTGDITQALYEKLKEGEQEDRIVVSEEELRRLRATVRRWKHKADTFERGLEFVDRVCRVVENSLTALPPIEPPELLEPPEYDSDEVVVLHISDVHVGKRTKTYDPDMFITRMDKLKEGMMSIVDAMRSIRPLRKLVIVFNGDIVDAESVYPGQAVDKIAVTILDQIYTFAVPEFVQFVRFCLANFEEVECYCTYGNHGRQPMKWTSSKSTNWDLVFYHSLKTALRGEERLTWHIADKDWKQMFEILGWGFLSTHGQMIRRYYQLPFYGMTRQCMRWQATYLRHDTPMYAMAGYLSR